MQNELEYVRDQAKARIQTGGIPDWSWYHHVTLIEAIDAVLHDMSMMPRPSEPARRAERSLRLVGMDGSARLLKTKR
jgi:hypothetical protein